MLEYLFLLGNSHLLSSLYSQIAKKDLEESAQIILYLVENNTQEQYQEIFKNSPLRFTLISTKGEVLYDSMNPNKVFPMENHLSRVEVQEAIKKGSGFDIRTSQTFGEKFAYYSHYTTSKDRLPVLVRLSSSYEEQSAQLTFFRYVQLAFFLLLNLTILFFYKNYLKRDLQKKFEIMKHFLESGENEKSSYLSEETWIHQFWILLKEWQHNNLENIDTLSKEKKTLQSLLDSLPFFVALIDAAGNIQLKNQHFRYLLQKESTSYLDAFASIELVEILSSCFSRKESYQGFLYLKQQDKYLSIELEYLPFRNYFLLLIRDVSEEKKKEMFQRTFLNDISHELKTPLTNIKGYLIAMEDSKEEEKQNFLDIVLQNVQKMENTLHDFFKLSKIENTSSSEKQTFSMQELEEELHFLLQKLLQEKHGDFSITVEQNISFFLEKEELITILKNLLENAILYNTNPSPVITLRIFTSTEHYIFEVIDNGSGIPLIEQERIFNRFYRIEKSRNRNSGGTGLGLSIVKTLTQKLQGDIFIKESSSQGTTFCLLLPKER
ncbi:sensor histidine kinase [Fusobacterium necrophorum]|uniref:histidine kinase n=2 Tax=Fusobacterium necrophorum TaxID=859 RepID=A0AAN3VUN7_9FUSO|nr:HAMP domain-containing sensor histidine kinase [Fusobacterium necrophorum]EJU16007.1 GHKL domain protein [Fusobacterium necrophorum subsp. funduliforme Fnf 1007]KYL01208.1 histidine kinase [Fusobacterium necrophorum subsp. funduliforme]KYM41595.1 histidine kinase [Fusobacterium necrophorum subsp. funduliforme]KYM43999.1 histidine kinase [Fusobacterium necrophorum subsp. funduliforme]KYM48014.1 histidine kinase [Fusobacterium necrophorum subsp. funduliforme]